MPKIKKKGHKEHVIYLPFFWAQKEKKEEKKGQISLKEKHNLFN